MKPEPVVGELMTIKNYDRWENYWAYVVKQLGPDEWVVRLNIDRSITLKLRREQMLLYRESERAAKRTE